MLLPILLAVFPVTPVATVQVAAAERPRELDDLSERRRAAGNDVAKLWELSLWCEAQAREPEARDVWSRILELDAKHAGAHAKLCHHFYSDQWFETYRALSAFRRAEDRRMLERGLVRWGTEWIPKAQQPFLRMQWARDESGTWQPPAALERKRLAVKLAADGWQQQDTTWIHPDDFGKWRAGLWKCGNEWLETPAADAFHADIARWWEVPGEHFVTYSTCDRESLRWIVWWADQAYADLVRAVGVEPKDKPHLVVLKNLEQYNDFAAGNADAHRLATEAAGWSSVHYAFLADSWVERATGEYLGSGVCYWDAQSESLKAFGQHAVRHAAAQSYLESIDPSWAAVSQLVSSPPGTTVVVADFWSEKKLPRWLRYGVASYVERYFEDKNVGPDGDRWWARTWSIANLRNAGGLAPLKEVFACEIDPNDPARSSRRITEAGLVVSFLLDGDCAPVTAKHAALEQALAGESTSDAVQALERALIENEKQLRAYAGL